MTKYDPNLFVDAQQLRAIFDTAVDCFIIIDARGMIARINPAGAKLFGYAKRELLGQKINILMPSPHQELHDAYLKNYHLTGESKIVGVGCDVRAQKKCGEIFPCKLSLTEFMINDEKCFAGIIHDLTLRKESEEKILELNKQLEKAIEVKSNDLSEVVNKLLQSNARLEIEIAERKRIEETLRHSEKEIRKALEKERELNDLKSRFVTMASHEFRTPLSTILSSTGLVEQYLEKGQPEKITRHCGKIKSSIKDLTEILEDFLSLAKLEEGKLKQEPQHFKLGDFCEDFTEDVQGLLKPGQLIQKGINVNGDIVFLDKKILRHIFLNLFSNAIKYSPENTPIGFEINIKENNKQNFIEATVKDAGIGIPKSDQKHLFSRFFRGSNAINIKGTGLGLNIVKQYVNMLEGDIQFKSKENEGTAFTVSIPIQNK